METLLVHKHRSRNWVQQEFLFCVHSSKRAVCIVQVLDKNSMQDKQILYPSSGYVVPGEMCALVGPSGAGVLSTPSADCNCHVAWLLPSAYSLVCCVRCTDASVCVTGKSTLLDILAMRKGGKLEGQVCQNPSCGAQRPLLGICITSSNDSRRFFWLARQWSKALQGWVAASNLAHCHSPSS